MSGSGSGSESEEDDKVIDLENQFYTATDEMEEGNLEEALTAFHKTVEMEAEFLKEGDIEESKWTFKSLIEIVSLTHKLGKTADVLPAYKAMLSYKGDDVNDNLLTRAISRILDTVASGSDAELEAALYDATGDLAGGGKGSGGNKRIWFKTNMKKATAHLNAKRYEELKASIKELEDYVNQEGGKSDQLLDVYSLEIQMYMDQADKPAVKRTYEKAVTIVKSNPGTLTSKLPIFQFCGGKIMMEDGAYDEAYATLFDAFKYYQDIGSDLRIPCLKYMLFANMLKEVSKKEDKINPFDSKEVANMRNHASIEPISQLLDAYERNNIRAFERLLRENAKDIMEDEFLKQFVHQLLTKVRIAKILEMVKPYSRINTQFLATQLTIDREEVEELLVHLILESEIEGTIDQIKHVLELTSRADSAQRYRAIEKWSNQLNGVQRMITSSVF